MIEPETSVIRISNRPKNKRNTRQIVQYAGLRYTEWVSETDFGFYY